MAKPTPDSAVQAATPDAAGPPRLLSLDVLRGVAILLVLGDHPPLPYTIAGPLAPLAAAMQRFGWTGVDLFFVLSGFLIGGLLFHELRTTGTLDVRRFYIRRALRIWPSYYLLVGAALVALVIRSHGHIGAALRIMAPNLLHMQNYWPADRPLRQTWSLAVEEHFYAALPVLVWLAAAGGRPRRRELRAVPIGALAVIVTCAAVRLCVLTRLPYTFWTHAIPTHVRIDSLAFGVLLAYGYHYAPARFAALSRIRGVLMVAGLALVSPMLFVSHAAPFVWTVGYVMLYLGYGAVLVAAVGVRPDTPEGRVLASAPVRLVAWIGTYSYTIYLWMAFSAIRPVQAVMGSLPHLPGAVAWCLSMVVCVVMAVAAGVVAGRLIDEPVLALRNRLYPARATPLRGTAAS